VGGLLFRNDLEGIDIQGVILPGFSVELAAENFLVGLLKGSLRLSIPAAAQEPISESIRAGNFGQTQKFPQSRITADHSNIFKGGTPSVNAQKKGNSELGRIISNGTAGLGEVAIKELGQPQREKILSKQDQATLTGYFFVGAFQVERKRVLCFHYFTSLVLAIAMFS
jgi:hypothetical protein